MCRCAPTNFPVIPTEAQRSVASPPVIPTGAERSEAKRRDLLF